jgi:hypothetical protein
MGVDVLQYSSKLVAHNAGSLRLQAAKPPLRVPEHPAQYPSATLRMWVLLLLWLAVGDLLGFRNPILHKKSITLSRKR